MASTKEEVNTTLVTPATWVTDQLVTADDLNTEISDQIVALHIPAYAVAVIDEASDYSTSSTSFVDIDGAGTSLTVTITTAGGPVLIGFMGSAAIAGGYIGFFNVDMDGADLAPDDGFIAMTGTVQNVSFQALLTPTECPAGSHTFKMRYKVSNASGSLIVSAGAGTSARDIHPRFWVIEL